MANLFPGAEWRPMPGQEKRPARRKGRGVGFHVAVYTGPSIYDINLRTGNDAHLYVRLDGSVEQNVDLDLQAWAGIDGNPSMIWVETAGGVDPRTVNTELWNPAMAVTLARIARWAHDTEGIPLQVMPDSKPTSRGIGTHRLGITHSLGIGAVPGFRVAGGESWSNVIGKACPGDAKVAQVPSIVTAAINNTGDPFMALTDKQQTEMATTVGLIKYAVEDLVKPSTDQIPALVAAIKDLTAAVAKIQSGGTVSVQAVADQLTVVPKP